MLFDGNSIFEDFSGDVAVEESVCVCGCVCVTAFVHDNY